MVLWGGALSYERGTPIERWGQALSVTVSFRLLSETDLGVGFRVQDLGFRVQGSEFRVQSSGLRAQGSGFRVQGSGLEGSGFSIQG